MFNCSVSKKLIAGACSLLTALASPQIIPAAAEEQQRNSIAGASITLGGEIGVNFYLDLKSPDSFDSLVLDGPKGELSFSAEELVPESSGSCEGLYKLTYPVAPSQLDENVTLALKKGDGSALLYLPDSGKSISCVHYSVRKYIDAVSRDETVPSDLSVLVDSLDIFGRYCEAHFGSADAPSEDAPLPDISASDLEKYRPAVNGELPQGVSVLGMALLLDSDTSLRIYFSSHPGTAYIDGSKADVFRKDGSYYIEVRDIGAKDLNTVHRAAVGGFTMELSALSYVYNVLSDENGSSGELTDLAKALFAYSFAADVYFESPAGEPAVLSGSGFSLSYDGSDDYADNYSFIYGDETFTAHYTPYLGGDWKIVDSYRITDRGDMVVICEALLKENKVSGRITRFRTAKDMADEWVIHDQGYTLAKAYSMTDAVRRLKDVDMDKKDQGKTFGDFLNEFLGK